MWRKPDIQIVTAGSILGLRPSGVEKLSEVLLKNGLASKLNCKRNIIHLPTLNHLYDNQRDEQTHVMNAQALRNFSLTVSGLIQKTIPAKTFTLILGGDCSILIGIMSGLKSVGTFGLFFTDAHADFYEPEKSVTGEAADMDLAIVTGRGPDVLTNINHLGPYVRDENVIHIGQRDTEETIKYNSQDIRSTAITCIDEQFIQKLGVHQALIEIDKYAKNKTVDGFWIHFDTDVIDDNANPAVDYRLPGGLSFSQCNVMLKHLIKKYPVAGMSVTILNPDLDKDGSVADKLTSMLLDVLV